MGASRLEFRVRMLINAIIIVVGFWAPWTASRSAWAAFGPHVSLLEWLALHVSRLGLAPFSMAAPVVIAVAALFAAVGAVLRVSGAAYLGAGTVHGFDMRAEGVVAAGPYRFVRNPLYMGVWFMVAALAFLMPPSGALVAMIGITLFQLRLILGEEAFLAKQIGEPYLAYRRAVPRIIPRFRGAPALAAQNPQWVGAVLTELTPIGVFVALAFCSWSYDNELMIRTILVSFGLSLVMRAMPMGKIDRRANEA